MIIVLPHSTHYDVNKQIVCVQQRPSQHSEVGEQVFKSERVLLSVINTYWLLYGVERKRVSTNVLSTYACRTNSKNEDQHQQNCAVAFNSSSTVSLVVYVFPATFVDMLMVIVHDVNVYCVDYIMCI